MCIQYCSKSLLKIGFMSPRLLPSKGEPAEIPARKTDPFSTPWWDCFEVCTEKRVLSDSIVPMVIICDHWAGLSVWWLCLYGNDTRLEVWPVAEHLPGMHREPSSVVWSSARCKDQTRKEKEPDTRMPEAVHRIRMYRTCLRWNDNLRMWISICGQFICHF